MSSVCERLYSACSPRTPLHIALLREAIGDAHRLRDSEPGRERIVWRLYVQETLQACREFVDEDFYRTTLAKVRRVLAEDEQQEEAA